MKIIGITGGVGAGKTQVLSYIEQHYKCRIIRADEAAHLLYGKGEECYNALISLLGKQILTDTGDIDKKKMAELIFKNKTLLENVNSIVHPAVKKYIMEEISKENEEGKNNYFFIEAALLIEERYDRIVDEMWYIYSDAKTRRERLKTNRNYSDDKITGIMSGQLSEEDFRRSCQQVISNNGNLEETYKQIQLIMGD